MGPFKGSRDHLVFAYGWGIRLKKPNSCPLRERNDNLSLQRALRAHYSDGIPLTTPIRRSHCERQP